MRQSALATSITYSFANSTCHPRLLLIQQIPDGSPDHLRFLLVERYVALAQTQPCPSPLAQLLIRLLLTS